MKLILISQNILHVRDSVTEILNASYCSKKVTVKLASKWNTWKGKLLIWSFKGRKTNAYYFLWTDSMWTKFYLKTKQHIFYLNAAIMHSAFFYDLQCGFGIINKSLQLLNKISDFFFIDKSFPISTWCLHFSFDGENNGSNIEFCGVLNTYLKKMFTFYLIIIFYLFRHQLNFAALLEYAHKNANYM